MPHNAPINKAAIRPTPSDKSEIIIGASAVFAP